MGRLTLNVLLSFAQFEREVTGERIRDKIAASKKKGLWMGGPVPLGYDVRDRKLVVNEREAELVRHIMRRYLALGSVKELIAELDREGYRTKIQQRTSGPHRGGCPFRRGTLYHLLANRIYLGEIVHKGVFHPGEHEPIVSQDLWDEVQSKLTSRGPGLFTKRDGLRRSILAGLIVDGLNRPMTPNHAVKGSKRYRYYVTRDPSAEQPAWRVGAHDIECVVRTKLEELLLDRDRIARMVITVDPRQVDQAVVAAGQLAAARSKMDDPTTLGIEQIRLLEDRIDVIIDPRMLLKACGVEVGDPQFEPITLSAPVERVRRGHELKLIIPGDAGPEPSQTVRDERLVTLLSEAIEARQLVLTAPEQSLQQIAAAQGRCRKRLAKLVRLSWLAPDAVIAILNGKQAASLTANKLLDAELPIGWADQRKALELA